MAAIEVSRSIDGAHTADEARRRVLQHFASAGAKVALGESGEIVATRGSRLLIRLFGAHLMPRDRMPTMARVTIEPVGRGSRTTVTLADHFGFGIRTGMRRRYLGLLEDQLDAIASALS